MKYKIECGLTNGLIRYYVKKRFIFVWATIYVATYKCEAESVVKELLSKPKYYDSKKQKS